MNCPIHIKGVSTLKLDDEKCTGCGTCARVCPHGLFTLSDGRIVVEDHDRCMECGACVNNCQWGALSVSPGVGCAAYIIGKWLHERGLKKSGSSSCC